jgi:L-fucose mutarotase
MLKTGLLHPGILQALGESGHGSQVLIADGNYPLRSGTADAAHRVYLNLAPGMVGVTDVLRALVGAIPVEGARVMGPDDGSEPPIFADFRGLLEGIELERLGRHPFYEAARGRDVTLAIATGDQRLYANILLTIGVVPPA